MLPDFELRLRAFAEVIVRVGLNLQPGQRLLIAEPYELQGVSRSAEVIVDAVTHAVGRDVDVIWGDGPRLREFAERADWRGFTRLVEGNAERMRRHLGGGGAFLFLPGSQPRLMEAIPVDRVSQLHRIGWEHFGPIVQRLLAGESQWTLAPAPSPTWAAVVYADLPSEQRLAALWTAVFDACRIEAGAPSISLEAWRQHLASLQRRRDNLNARRLTSLRYQGTGTDLTVKLPAKHRWCTAATQTRRGIPFVMNLPTEEVFTAPHKNSAEGTVHITPTVNHAGAAIDGIELQFRKGRVAAAAARTGGDLLQRLLETDGGACRLGEVAIVHLRGQQAAPRDWQRAGRQYGHPLLDENTANHVALGDAYRFCLDSFFPFALNRSLVHVDLPLAADVILPEMEPT